MAGNTGQRREMEEFGGKLRIPEDTEDLSQKQRETVGT